MRRDRQAHTLALLTAVLSSGARNATTLQDRLEAEGRAADLALVTALYHQIPRSIRSLIEAPPRPQPRAGRVEAITAWWDAVLARYPVGSRRWAFYEAGKRVALQKAGVLVA